MAVSYEAPFTQVMKTAQAVCTAACTTYNDAANKVLLLTAGADGALVKKLIATPRATVTATQLQLYLSKDNGVTMQFVGSVLMAAYTMAASTAAPSTDFGFSGSSPFRLAAGDRLYVAIGVALVGGIVFHAEYEDF